MISSNLTDSKGNSYRVEYFDADTFDNLPIERCKQCYGVCFYQDKMVIGFGGMKKGWGLIGGSVEPGETLIETLVREIKEESNMKIIRAVPVGYQKLSPQSGGEPFYQLRYAATVEPYGEFIGDSGEGMSGEKAITDIKFIDPKNYKDYFDWGEIGERIIERAVELKDSGSIL